MGADRRPVDDGRGTGCGRRCRAIRRTARREPGVLRVTDGEIRVLESGDNGVHPAAEDLADVAAPEPIELTEAVLEALLFVAERPLSRREIAALAGTDRETVDARLGDLEVSLRARGIRLVLSGDRVELVTAPEAGALIARYVGADAVRLSPASLETLAIVAYRQPVTRSAIERIRGVDSDYTVRTLLHRRLIVELGRSDAPGRPFLYGTGFDFLERFGLTSLDELPPLEVDVAARLAEEGGEELPAEPDRGAGRARHAGRAGRRTRRPDARRAPPEGARRGRRRVAPGKRGPHRQGPRDRRRPGGEGRRPGRPGALRDRGGRPGHRIGGANGVPAAPQAGRRDLDHERPARRADRARSRPDGARPRGCPPVPGRAPRPGFRGTARPDQRRRVGRTAPPSPLRRGARVRARAADAADARAARRPPAGDRARRGRSRNCAGCARSPTPTCSGSSRSWILRLRSSPGTAPS